MLCGKGHKLSLEHGGSYIESLKWMHDKKAAINPQSKDEQSFQYMATAALNHL